jgi:hypothetical protein
MRQHIHVNNEVRVGCGLRKREHPKEAKAFKMILAIVLSVILA